jgi:hypothetical protein
MKPLYALLILLVFSETISGQAYVPFPDSNVIWSEANRRSSFDPITAHFYKLGNTDTVMSGTAYRRLYRSDDTLFSDNECVGGIRQDIAQKKVFFYSNYGFAAYQEALLYDFSVNAGDTVFADANNNKNNWQMDLIVHSVDSVQINGQFRRRINLRFAALPNIDLLPCAWVEGVGNIVRGVVFPSGTLPNNGMWNELMCLQQNGTYVYQNTTDWNAVDTESFQLGCPPVIQGIADADADGFSCLVYPNPATGNINLQLPQQGKVDFVQIFSLNGQLMEQRQVSTEKVITIDCKHYAKGIYIYSLHKGNGTTVTDRFAVE